MQVGANRASRLPGLLGLIPTTVTCRTRGATRSVALVVTLLLSLAKPRTLVVGLPFRVGAGSVTMACMVEPKPSALLM